LHIQDPSRERGLQIASIALQHQTTQKMKPHIMRYGPVR
jgi:hypothetical protein